MFLSHGRFIDDTQRTKAGGVTGDPTKATEGSSETCPGQFIPILNSNKKCLDAASDSNNTGPSNDTNGVKHPAAAGPMAQSSFPQIAWNANTNGQQFLERPATCAVTATLQQKPNGLSSKTSWQQIFRPGTRASMTDGLKLKAKRQALFTWATRQQPQDASNASSKDPHDEHGDDGGNTHSTFLPLAHPAEHQAAPSPLTSHSTTSPNTASTPYRITVWITAFEAFNLTASFVPPHANSAGRSRARTFWTAVVIQPHRRHAVFKTSDDAVAYSAPQGVDKRLLLMHPGKQVPVYQLQYRRDCWPLRLHLTPPVHFLARFEFMLGEGILGSSNPSSRETKMILSVGAINVTHKALIACIFGFLSLQTRSMLQMVLLCVIQAAMVLYLAIWRPFSQRSRQVMEFVGHASELVLFISAFVLLGSRPSDKAPTTYIMIVLLFQLFEMALMARDLWNILQSKIERKFLGKMDQQQHPAFSTRQVDAADGPVNKAVLQTGLLEDGKVQSAVTSAQSAIIAQRT
ncbi:hypothetical protein VOLCADRAFT_95841 [Volvox carteri f. nagariensis]|uniref:TRP C-terminal domain-containing protein n=1 Tax=Volvox carteri f. nagariensis TaxID=3068 RepID=D8U8I5_VOLCA|nr:uncharacterized protein VOLCADRAFT_95841 [Volvox carteri f. nagariensis]EFJ43986.1 hypothetical protein VOLCADRAFT_95841 [Volvox carteri f. nagariensis]|eukprot:XP_002954998.1 hypothetical protein VOLCADRAFT_95841 [Volvox carteri f. nagariensis]